MAFAGSDNPITELVWSPQGGLSFRCANNSGSADKRPLFVWNVGSIGKDLPPSHESMKSDSNGGGAGKKTLTLPRTVLGEGDMSCDKAPADTLAGPSRSFLALEISASRGDCDGTKNKNIMEEVGTTKDVIPEKGNCSDNGDEDLCETAGFAGLRRKDDAGLITLSDGISDCKRDKSVNRPSSTRVTRKTHCNHNNNNVEEVNTCSKEKTDSKVAEVFVGTAEVNMNNANAPLPISALPLRRDKGKEKAVSDESAETCNNSVRLFSKGIIKRQREDDGRGLMIHGSKRMKKKTKMDSSFMKWISNMVKGLPERSTTVKEESSSLGLSKALHYDGVSNTGIQTIFQSLNCRNLDISNDGVRNDNDSTEESRQINEKFPDGINDNSCKQSVVVSDKEVGNPTKNVGQSSRPWIFSEDIICSPYSRVENEASGNLACDRAKDGVIPSDSLGKQVNSTEEKTSLEKVTPLKSFWVTRFSTSTPEIEKHDGCTTDRLKSNTKNEKCNKSFPLFNNVTAKDKLVPSGIFHAIRNLGLSRSDILRWMNSNVSLSNLSGFFLRLRLGKMEEGIGATRYYVACITGDAREHNGSRSKKSSILVDVGGIKSSVESQYVSNHDFLEDEIKAWWCRTVDNGCKIPSLDELSSKVHVKKSLHF